MVSQDRNAVLIIGGQGEFGQFLQHARHILLATPLTGYAELACEVVYRCSRLQQPTTLWLIPSVQAGVWRAVTATLEIVGNAFLSAVFAHPMYGPNGFRAIEPEARTFQNILTATYEGARHPLAKEMDQLSKTFRDTFNITTTIAFDPEEHDRLTAYSQGLSYCVGHLMFERLEFDRILAEQMPELHHSFHANHDLILDFLRINAYMPQVAAAFADSWRQTNERTYEDLLRAFGRADKALNRGNDSPIPTKWYQKLRTAAYKLV